MTQDNGARPGEQPADKPKDNLPPTALDLDALEREGGSPIPFVFVLGGKRYLLSDPKEIDWQDLISALTNPYMFFKLMLPPDDQDTFFGTKVPSWKLNTLVESYIKHYGLPSAGEADALPR